MTAESRLPVWDAVRFLWHSAIAHRAHAADVYYDARQDCVRCRACGRTWGESR